MTLLTCFVRQMFDSLPGRMFDRSQEARLWILLDR